MPMGRCDPSLIQKLCAAVATECSEKEITKEEGIALFKELFGEVNLDEKVRRIQARRAPHVLKKYQNYKPYWSICGHMGAINRVGFDNSSEFAFTGSGDKTIKMWNIPKGLLVHTLFGHNGEINDICVSASGKYLISADSSGIIIVWSLETFKEIHTLDMGCEVIFCEMILLKESSLHGFTCVLANDVIKTVIFSDSGIVSENENAFMKEESIKSICVTDGGRFFVCGGWWPFLLLYDTQNLDTLIVLDDLRVQTLCACRRALKIAASSGDKISVYTFFSETRDRTQAFKKKKSIPGYWTRSVLISGEAADVERMCFLPSLFLVTLNSDGMIRVYDDRKEVAQIEGEAGYLYSHPLKDVFVVIGRRLSIYAVSAGCSEGIEFPTSSIPASNLPFGISGCSSSFNKVEELENNLVLVYAEEVSISINDADFSPDGRFFLTVDCYGSIKAYSISNPISCIPAQFFAPEFSVPPPSSQQLNERMTYDKEKNINKKWKAEEYRVKGTDVRKLVLLEDLAAEHLQRERLDYNTFFNLYFLPDDSPEEIAVSSECLGTRESEESVSYNQSESSSESDSDIMTSEDSDNTSGEEVLERTEKHQIKRNTRRIVAQSSEDSHSLSTETSEEEVRRRVRMNRAPKVKALSSSSESTVYRRQRRIVVLSSSESNSVIDLDPEFEESLAVFSRKWITSFFVYKGDQVYFDSEAYKVFVSLEGRLLPDEDIPESGFHKVLEVKYGHIGKIPYIDLLFTSYHRVQYYEYPNGTGIACLKQQYYSRGHATILQGDVSFEGEITGLDGLMILLNGKTYLRSSILLLQETKLSLKQINYEPRFKVLFGRVRKWDDVSLDLEILNYDVVNVKIAYKGYRNKNQLFYDLRVIQKIARTLGSEHLEYSKDVFRRLSRDLSL